MRNALRIGLACPLLLLAAYHASNLKSLYDGHNWFALRAAILNANAPPLYRGAVEAAFNQPAAAARDLSRAIKASPKSEQAYQAHELLAEMFFREGQCTEAMAQAHAMAGLKPGDQSEDGGTVFCGAVGNVDQSINKDSRPISLQMKDGYMLPVIVNGKHAYYGFDTGSIFSTMSESEAQRLGLDARPAGTASGVAGRGVTIRAVVVRRLTIGNSVLNNVAFVVFPDTQEPFADLPASERGILGLPVLLALRSVRWTKKGAFQIHPAAADTKALPPNVCLDGVIPAVQVQFQGRKLIFGLDTGVDRTILYQKFAAEFAGLVKRAGQERSKTSAGYDGTLTQSVIRLPQIAIQVGGLDTTLRPADIASHLQPNATPSYYGNLGMDIMGRPREVTLNFREMTLTLE